MALALGATAGCGDGSPAETDSTTEADGGGAGGAGGAGGTAGLPDSGVAGTGGSGGSGGTSGTGNSGGTGATGGAGGSAGTGGTSAGGAGGEGGTGETGGMGGTGGAAGSAGAAGAGGSAGAAGSAGAGGSTWPPECSDCHGGAANPAPPVDIHGNVDTINPTVGAHQSHLRPAAWHREIQCAECHVVPSKPGWDPNTPTHLNGINDLAWGPVAKQGAYNTGTSTCTASYCHGSMLAPDAPGLSANREPVWTIVDGSQASCGTSCHTLPPGGGHPAATACEACHSQVIAAFSAGNPPSVAWTDASLHINGNVEVTGMTCTSCHGDPATSNPAPPTGTNGETSTTDPAVGAHAGHLAASNWHRQGQCGDCHTVPATIGHSNGMVDFSWGGPSNTGNPGPSYTAANSTCTNTYCHGTTLDGPKPGGTTNRTPDWTVVDDTQDACGTTCHTNPPGGTHPAANNCEMCHDAVVSSFVAGSPPKVTWKNPDLHVDGMLQVANLSCTSCHGDPASSNPAPPRGTHGETATTDPAVGAHARHLASSTWHRQGQCTDCHAYPASVGHSNGMVDFSWGGPSNTGNPGPSYTAANSTCANTYCHGTTLDGPKPGGTTHRTPDWTVVNDTQDACGTTCHTNPPGGTHPAANSCEMCHDAVVSSFVPGNPPKVTWKNPGLHVDGMLQVANLSCTSCHGDSATSNPAPPRGTHGETATGDPAVGAHARHLASSTWHRQGQCTDCHAYPASVGHSNGMVDFSWGGPSNTGNPGPSYVAANSTCTNTYCHGVTLDGPKPGGTTNRTPDWTVVNDTQDACGTTCHTNPPGDTHVALTNCTLCHAEVIATYDPVTRAATWVSAAKHVDGLVESNRYHDLPLWKAPEKQSQHHGTAYFIANRQRDEHGAACVDCHGADLNGGSVGVSCNSSTCHGGKDWKSCAFCHGTEPTQSNPPVGVLGETTTNTLAVGRHSAHLAAGPSHVAFSCDTCHHIPDTGTVDHALDYLPSSSLDVSGHHGDVLFSGAATGMTFNVAATQGAPVTARGTCLLACHSDGRGNAPNVIPYWAGGAWTPGDCGSCHDASPTTNQHGVHHGAAGCETCHPPANGSTHVNGARDVRSFITGPKGGGIMPVAPGSGGPGAPCGDRWMCNGMCHGNDASEFHNKYCW